MCMQLNEGNWASATCSSSLELEAYPAWQGSGRSLPHSTLDPILSTLLLSVAGLLLLQFDS